MPNKTSHKLSLIYLSLLLVTLSTRIEFNSGSSFPCGSSGVEVLDDDSAVSCAIVNVGTTLSARTYQLELMIPYRLVTCPSHGCV